MMIDTRSQGEKGADKENTVIVTFKFYELGYTSSD